MSKQLSNTFLPILIVLDKRFITKKLTVTDELIFSGAYEIRTRDLLRDRQAF